MIEEEMKDIEATKSASKLVKWKNPPSLADLKSDLTESRAAHSEQMAKVEKWLDNLNVTGKAAIKTGDGNSSIVPRLIRKQAEWRYAALSEPFLSSPDLFDIAPVSWEDREAAQQNQLILNNQFSTRIDRTGFIDEFVRAAVNEGTAVLRVGWKYEEEEYEEMVPVVEFRPNPELAPLYEELTALQQENPQGYRVDVPEELKQAHVLTLEQGYPMEATIVGYQPETLTRTVANHPTLEVCDLQNVIIDPTWKGTGDIGFVIYSFESSLSALEKDGRYQNLDQIMVNENSVLSDPDHHYASVSGAGFNHKDKPRKKFVVHEYWGYWDIDGTGQVKPIVASWVGNVLIRLEENPFPDKKVPFVVVQYLPVRRSAYGEPDGSLLEDNQRIAGAVTRGMIDIMGKSANGQTGIRKDMLDATNRRKFEKGRDYEFNPNVDPRQGIHMHTYPEIPASAQFMLQLQNMEAESLTGVKAFSSGLSGDSLGATATGARGALDAASKRELGILRRLAKGIEEAGRKIIAMNREFLNEEEVVRVTNSEFITVEKDDLAGNFDLRLTISTAEEDNQKAQELAFMLQTMGNNMDAEMSKMILSDIARLRKMPDLAKRIEAYQPQPDPMEQERVALELEKLKAEIENLRAHAMERQTGAELDLAKSGTEQAKARHLSSDTDLKNLNFVEQESGVTQERDLQKHQAQAQANKELKLLDHQLKKDDEKRTQLKEYLKKSR